MEPRVRRSFEGVLNIIRFNWHYYVASIAVVAVLLIISNKYFFFPGIVINTLVAVIITTTLLSLSISFYVYDVSNLYTLPWIPPSIKGKKEAIANIHAGFDETSDRIRQIFPDCELFVADFYDAEKHTEISIQRARKAFPPSQLTHAVNTRHLPIATEWADKVLLVFAAHEIRDKEERGVFFGELYRILKPGGKIFVTEHLRDISNFIAYNIGFFHFYPRSSWLETFAVAEFKVVREIKTTPFVTTFILERNGTAY